MQYYSLMKLLSIVVLALVPYLALAAAPAQTIVDYLRETPAEVIGRIRLQTTKSIYSGQSQVLGVNVPIGMRLVPTRSVGSDLGFSFDENSLQITGGKALELTVMGVPLRIKKLTYNNVTGKFSVETTTPGNLLSKEINDEIVKTLEAQYKAKMRLAFAQLAQIRAKNKLGDVQQVMNTISQIFTDKSKPPEPLPNMSGEVGLVFVPSRTRVLGLDQLNATVSRDDQISANLQFVRRGGQTAITGLEMNSLKGIRVTAADNSMAEFKSLIFRQATIDSSGVHVNYSIGAEQVLAGLAVALNGMEAVSRGPAAGCTGCGAQFATVRNSLDVRFRNELAILIRKHRAELLQLNVDPAILNAFD